jgi:hypothetical protein
MMANDDGADFRQQQEQEEFEQYLEENAKWLKEQNAKFNEIFLGGKANEHEQDTE